MISSPTQQELSNFHLEPFVPFLTANPHFHTIVSRMWPSPSYPHYTRVTLPTADGTAHLYLDIVNGDKLAPTPGSTQPVALVVPGMESHSRATVTRRLLHELAVDHKVVVMNHRSCGGVTDCPTTLRLYHAAFTDDVLTVLHALRAHAPNAPPRVHLAGFSLGANMLVHVLAERDDVRQLGVAAAVAVGVPFAPAECIRHFDAGLSGAFYSAHLARHLRRKVLRVVERGGDVGRVDLRAVRAATRVGMMDAALVGPAFGFRDRWHYYECADVRQHLRHVRVPLLVLNARDDPFFDHADGTFLPCKRDIGDAPVVVHVLAHGGHCGFLDRKAVGMPDTGYFQRQCARWFRHVSEVEKRLC